MLMEGRVLKDSNSQVSQLLITLSTQDSVITHSPRESQQESHLVPS
jgi:hypothetical protein